MRYALLASVQGAHLHLRHTYSVRVPCRAMRSVMLVRYCNTMSRVAAYNQQAWKRVRLVVLERDGWQCQICGIALLRSGRRPASACVDHIVPLSKGGDRFEETNLRACCFACNGARVNRKVDYARTAYRPRRVW